MASMTIRNIDAQLKSRLRVRAAKRGNSMEEEAREILRAALSTEAALGQSLIDAIRLRLEPGAYADLELPAREPMRPPIDLGE